MNIIVVVSTTLAIEFDGIGSFCRQHNLQKHHTHSLISNLLCTSLVSAQSALFLWCLGIEWLLREETIIGTRPESHFFQAFSFIIFRCCRSIKAALDAKYPPAAAV